MLNVFMSALSSGYYKIGNPDSTLSKEVALTSLTKHRSFLLYIAVIFMAANLRPTITGVGPLINVIAHSTGLSSEISGLVTTLPLIAFGVISPLAPGLAERFGMERTLFVSVIVLAIGTLLRSTGTAWALLAGMLVVGASVAVGNVLLPSLIKRDFPLQIGLLTGVYVTVMNVFAGLASGISVPLARTSLGWKGSLAIWVLLALVALIAWAPLLKERHRPERSVGKSFWRSSVAWQITFFMGLQSLLFYVNVAWLPSLLHSRGMPLGLAGWLVSLMQLVSLPATFIIPILATRQRNQQTLVILISLCFFIGYAGLLFTRGTVLSVIWVIFIGFGAGASISLALAFFSLRTRHHEHAGQVSGMAQSVGYLLAAIGPLLVGYLYGQSGHWNWPLIILLVSVILMAIAGMGAGRDIYIDEDMPNAPRQAKS